MAFNQREIDAIKGVLLMPILFTFQSLGKDLMRKGRRLFQSKQLDIDQSRRRWKEVVSSMPGEGLCVIQLSLDCLQDELAAQTLNDSEEIECSGH